MDTPVHTGMCSWGGNLSVSVHEYMCVNVCVRTSVFSSSDHFWSGSSIVFQTMA